MTPNCLARVRCFQGSVENGESVFSQWHQSSKFSFKMAASATFESLRVNGNVVLSLGIKRTAFMVQALKAFRVTRERPTFTSLHSFACYFKVNIDPNSDAIIPKQLDVLRASERASSQCKYGGSAPANTPNTFLYRLVLDPAKLFFSGCRENFGDPLTLGMLDVIVEIREAPANLFRQQAAHRRLPGTHEADNDKSLAYVSASGSLALSLSRIHALELPVHQRRKETLESNQ